MEIVSIKDKVAQKSLEKLDIPGIEKNEGKTHWSMCPLCFTKHVSIQAECFTCQK